MITVERYHDFSCGHRVCGHETKCRHLHGHNYRVTFVCAGVEQVLDVLGRVIDFSVIKDRLCNWLEENWDHKMLLWEDDPMMLMLRRSASGHFPWGPEAKAATELDESIVPTAFNPTAENMADYLLSVIGPRQLKGTGVQLVSVRVEETRKCSAVASL